MRELISYLPENYPESRETVAFQEALQPEVSGLWAARDDLLAQLDLYRATWGLDYWEDGLGLPRGRGLDLELRRRVVAAKLQGRATTTPQVVKDVAETLLGVPVTVIEVFGEYRVELAVPKGFTPGAEMPRLKDQLRHIMPAHLDWACLIPVLASLPITARVGHRTSTAAPPPYRGEDLNVPVYATPLLGVNFSTCFCGQGSEEDDP